MEHTFCAGCGAQLDNNAALVENNQSLPVCPNCLEQIRNLMNGARHDAAAAYFVEKKKAGLLSADLMAFLSDSDRIRAYVTAANSRQTDDAPQTGERIHSYAEQIKDEFSQSARPQTPDACAKAVLEDPGYCMSVSGQRIQRAAATITIIEALAVFILMIALLIGEQLMLGLITAVVGILAAWLTYIFLNGFAKLVDNSCISASQALKTTQKNT